jgi:hypothetical protein
VAVMRRFRLRRAHQHACSCSCSNSPLHFDVSTCEGRTAAVAAPAQGRDRHIGAPASDLEHDAPCICISAQAGQRLPAGRAALSRSREPRRSRERARLVVRRQPVARPTVSVAPHLRMSAMCRMPCLGASACWKRLCRFCQVRARIFARRHVIWANGREAFADREHTGGIDSSRRWASCEADRPSWPGRVSKVAEIGSSRSLPSLAAQTPCEFPRPCARRLWSVEIRFG